MDENLFAGYLIVWHHLFRKTCVVSELEISSFCVELTFLDRINIAFVFLTLTGSKWFSEKVNKAHIAILACSCSSIIFWDNFLSKAPFKRITKSSAKRCEQNRKKHLGKKWIWSLKRDGVLWRTYKYSNSFRYCLTMIDCVPHCRKRDRRRRRSPKRRSSKRKIAEMNIVEIEIIDIRSPKRRSPNFLL
jgi:hypothetical protein